MSEAILVLGASAYQMETIYTAKNLGYRVITTDNRSENPGHQVADRAYDVDITNTLEVVKIARSELISGIISPGTDAGVVTAAVVAEELGLPGVPAGAARILTNKVLFRDFLNLRGLRVPGYRVLPAGGFHPSQMDGFQFPGVIKPDSSSGSKGVFIVRNPRELESRLAESRIFSRAGIVLCEQHIEGHQGTCEGMLVGGRVEFLAALDRQVAHSPYVTTVGHHVPSLLSAADVGKVRAAIEFVFLTLKVTDGPFDCDFICANGEIYLLELTPRLGGNRISHLIKASCGFDLIAATIRHACGRSSDLPRSFSPSPAAVVLLGVWDEGSLIYDGAELERLRAERWVQSVSIDFPMGTPVRCFSNGRNRIGEAFVSASSRLELDQRVLELRSRLRLAVAYR